MILFCCLHKWRNVEGLGSESFYLFRTYPDVINYFLAIGCVTNWLCIYYTGCHRSVKWKLELFLVLPTAHCRPLSCGTIENSNLKPRKPPSFICRSVGVNIAERTYLYWTVQVIWSIESQSIRQRNAGNCMSVNRSTQQRTVDIRTPYRCIRLFHI